MTDIKRGDDWISVSDALPDEKRVVFLSYRASLNFKPRRFMTLAIIEDGEWFGLDSMSSAYVFDDDYNADKFTNSMHATYTTHWMPLPKPPQGDDDD